MSATSPNPLVSLAGPLYGSFYLGTIMSTAFYGVSCMQTFYYYVHYEDDPLFTKLLVGTMWTLDTIREALSIAGVYKYIIAGLVNPLSFTTSPPEIILSYYLTGLLGLPTQGFLVHRIYIVSKKNSTVPLVWVVLALVQLVSYTVFTAKALYSVNGHLYVVESSILNSGILVTLGIVGLSFAAGVDILIAIIMTYILIHKRTTSNFARTTHILQLLTVFAVNTGAWTAIFALLTIILVHIFPTKEYYAVFVVPLGSVYCNTLLANLNVRLYVRGKRTYNPGVELLSSSSSRMADGTRGNIRSGDMKPVPSAREIPEVIKFPNTTEIVEDV